MSATTIRVSLSSLNSKWDTSRIVPILEMIEFDLLEEQDTHANVYANSVEIQIEVDTNRLPETVGYLREAKLI